MLVVGDKEMENDTVSVREKGKQGSYTAHFSEFISKLRSIVENKEMV